MKKKKREKMTYHNVPNELLGLGVVGLVPSADGDLLCYKKVEHFNLQRPETPTPVFPILVRLLWVVQVAHVPRLSSVHRHLHTCHLLPSSYYQHFPQTTASKHEYLSFIRSNTPLLTIYFVFFLLEVFMF